MSERTQPESEPGSRASSESEVRASRLAFVAHEVRNPLSTALWGAELLVRLSPAERGGARGEKLAAMCLRALSRLRLLLEDHFLAERLEVRGIPLHHEPLPLEELVEAAAVRFAPRADIRRDLEPGLTAFADRGLAERVVGAALAAAARDGAAVEVAARRDGERARLRVSGAPPAPDAFSDPERGSPSDPLGLALALPVARRAAEATGGSLSVEGGAYLVDLPLHGDGGPPERSQ